MHMALIPAYLTEAAAALDSPMACGATLTAKQAHAVALHRTQEAYRALADYRERVAQALRAIDETLANGQRLNHHEMDEPRYSSVVSSIRAANFRNALYGLRNAHSFLLADAAETRACLARQRAERFADAEA